MLEYIINFKDVVKDMHKYMHNKYVILSLWLLYNELALTTNIPDPQWPSGKQVWHLIIGCHLCGFESHKWQRWGPVPIWPGCWTGRKNQTLTLETSLRMTCLQCLRAPLSERSGRCLAGHCVVFGFYWLAAAGWFIWGSWLFL